MNPSEIVFRSDASLQIGTGHVMRCLTLADALTAKGADCRFICRAHEGNLIDFIRGKGYVTYALPVAQEASTASPVPGPKTANANLAHAHWLGATQAQDAEACAPILAANRPDWLIVDHYSLDARWESALRPFCSQILVIDDLSDRPHDCELLLDQSLRNDAAVRYRPLVPHTCRLLLGPEHVLLRPAFDNPAPRVRSGEIHSILVYFGGNDTCNQTGRAIEALCRFPAVAVEVILGGAHPHRPDVLTAARGLSHIRVVDTCSDMTGAMTRADLGLGTCGVAAWERCAVGLPTLVTVSADNQREDALMLDGLGAVEHLGEASDVSVADWVDALDRAFADPQRIARMSDIARTIVVGHQDNRRMLVDLMLVSDDR